jgi:hypothetical protein
MVLEHNQGLFGLTQEDGSELLQTNEVHLVNTLLVKYYGIVPTSDVVRQGVRSTKFQVSNTWRIPLVTPSIPHRSPSLLVLSPSRSRLRLPSGFRFGAAVDDLFTVRIALDTARSFPPGTHRG